MKTLFKGVCLAVAFGAQAFGQTFVVPKADAMVAGNSSFPAFFTPATSYEVQEVFAPDQFPAGPIYITGIAFRQAAGAGPINAQFSMNIYLSTRRNHPNSTQGPLLSTTFANNVGPDNTLMGAPNGGGSGPDCSDSCPFFFKSQFLPTQFLYNPANGPLLMDLQFTSALGTGSLDSFQCSAPGCAVTSVRGPLGSPSGSLVYGGLITQFTYMPAPTVGSPVTYYYTGQPFSQCDGGAPPVGAGPCPPSSFYASDYEIAALTLSAPLAPNLTNANLAASPNLISWTIGDALGLVSFSSTDANASAELQDLSLSTDGSGSIANWTLAAQSAPFENGQPGNAYIYVQSPALVNQQDFLVADALSYNGGSAPGGAGYNLGNAVTGSWTETLRGDQGGTTSAPVSLLSGSPVAQVSGTISGQGAEEYYEFYWDGGAFNATAYITGASNSASGLFTEGSAGTCTGGASKTLSDAGPLSFMGTIAIASLPPGEYCIGVNANNSNDASFALSFNPPLSAVYADAFFDGQYALGSPWNYLLFGDGNLFGYYAFVQGSPSTANAWLYHADLGYEYVVPGSASGSVYLYDLASNHWWYSSSSLFPYLYDFSLNSWIYYFPNTANPGHYTSAPRSFSNLTTQQIFTM
jgi:hypothetical protein